MFKLISIASVVILGSAVDLMPANAQSIRPVAQMETTSAVQDAARAKHEWFAHAIDDILTGSGDLPGGNDGPQEHQSTGH